MGFIIALRSLLAGIPPITCGAYYMYTDTCTYTYVHTRPGQGTGLTPGGCVGKGLVIHFQPYTPRACAKVVQICTGGDPARIWGWWGVVMVGWDAAKRFIYRVLCPEESAHHHPQVLNLQLSRSNEVYALHRCASCGVCIHRRGCHNSHYGVSFLIEGCGDDS